MSAFPSITCPVCQMTSYNANDIREGWCGKCNAFTGRVPGATATPRNVLQRRIAPGLWLDQENGIHWSLPELLAHFELTDTAEHRAQVTAFVEDIIVSLNPGQKIIYRTKPD